MDTLCPYVSVSDGNMVLALILLDTFQDTGLTSPLKKKRVFKFISDACQIYPDTCQIHKDKHLGHIQA